MVLGKYPNTSEPLQPKVKYVGNMHGNEVHCNKLSKGKNLPTCTYTIGN